MSYVTRADIEAEIDSYHLTAALDDNKDGVEDAGLFDALAAATEAQVSAHADAIAQLGNITVIGCKQAFLDKICTLIQQPG